MGNMNIEKTVRIPSHYHFIPHRPSDACLVRSVLTPVQLSINILNPLMEGTPRPIRNVKATETLGRKETRRERGGHITTRRTIIMMPLILTITMTLGI